MTYFAWVSAQFILHWMIILVVKNKILWISQKHAIPRENWNKYIRENNFDPGILCLNKTHYHGWCHQLITLEIRSRKTWPTKRKEFNKENAFNLGFQSPRKINLSQFHLLNIFFIITFPWRVSRGRRNRESNLLGLMLINMINAVQLDVSLHP